MGRWGDGEMGRWGDGEMGRFLLRVIILSQQLSYPNRSCQPTIAIAKSART
ncbi:MAG: hypothetical protein F6K50_14575 [Moorea sp. SIO3I7]|uniref:hypothetical protein n=1 Tax=Moorena sp. SIO3I8 TaxID=2607833 RepID=UPI0013C19661|nr:hypothetical protein [Moorena sp. SIO3I8]NEN96707.1 hypothetical protein [Moorena sp. SIO3I7]NEO09552.1 hypothetical protein [Moorena sp. SIO3I8]